MKKGKGIVVKKTKVCHMSSAHSQEDIRIFHKECVSLAKAGFWVFQITCGKTYENGGVQLIGIEDPKRGRLERMTKTTRSVYKAALNLDADIYHFHDPELLPYGLKLKKNGKKVIFDSHEDVPAQIMDKEWIPRPLRKIVSTCYKSYETYVVRQLDAVVAATPHIAETFKGRAKKVIIINNYPKLDDIEFQVKPFLERERIICYAGGINELRGEKIMIEAMKNVKGNLIIAGNHRIETIDFSNDGSGGCKIQYVGRLTREGVNKLYGKSRAGIVIYQPAKNHFESQPIKMFEFMAAGLPVIASDFPIWREIIEDSNCGLCVDPTDAIVVRNACEEMLRDPLKAEEMGKNGRIAVQNRYCWQSEERKLCDLYVELSHELEL